MPAANPNSVAQRAIKLIADNGPSRSHWIAEQLGIQGKDIAAHLGPYVKNGTLVACSVLNRNGAGRNENEYRLSATGPRSAVVRDMEVKRSHAVRSPIVTPGPVQREPETRLPSRIAIDAAAARPTQAAPSPPKETPVVASLHTAPTMPPRPDGFRCALASDGSMILFVPSHPAPIDLRPEYARQLVDYLRRLEELGSPPVSITLETTLPDAQGSAAIAPHAS